MGMMSDYCEGFEHGMRQRARDIIQIFNQIEDKGVGFRFDGMDLREYLMKMMYISPELWDEFLEGRTLMSQEEVDKLPQA